MRYTRLKKAVEAGHFRGAVLTQGPISRNPKLAAMANPESSRLAAEALKGGKTDKLQRATIDKLNTPISDDDLEEGYDEYGQAEDEDEEVEEVASEQLTVRPKRKRTEELPKDEDEDSFYPDMSVDTHKDKQIKAEVGDEQPEVIGERMEEAGMTRSSSKSSIVQLPSQGLLRASSPFTTQYSPNQTFHSNPMHPPSMLPPRQPPAATMHMHTPHSRDQEMVLVGIVSGQPHPTPEDISFAQARKLSSPMHQVLVRRNPAGRPPMRARFDHGPPSSFLPPSFTSPFPLPVPIQSAFSRPLPSISQPTPAIPAHVRFDAKKVFDGFTLPSVPHDTSSVPRASAVEVLSRRSSQNRRSTTLEQPRSQSRAGTPLPQQLERADVHMTPRAESAVPQTPMHSPVGPTIRPVPTPVNIDMAERVSEKVT